MERDKGWIRSGWIWTVLTLVGAFLAAQGCDDDEESAEETAAAPPAAEAEAAEEPSSEESGGAAAGETGELPDSLPNALVLAYAQFETEDGRVTPNPGPGRLEILRREGGEWHVQVIEDEDAVVFHKAMPYTAPGGTTGLLTLAGVKPVAEGQVADAEAQLKLWHPTAEGWEAETLWSQKFGGRVNRMRDAEVADLYGDQRPDIAVGTHDQGVVAVVRPGDDGWKVQQLGREANTFIHEIEIGDLNGDGTLEVYATPSEPNTLEGGEQPGQVVRFVPKAEEGRKVVADLGNRHAKEILVADVDGDGTDELYVAVEALTGGEGGRDIVEPVEIRRYDADTPPDQGVVIATINDRFNRFLTHGDVDGDGEEELIAAAFSSGVWLLEPGSNPRGEWSIESIDRDSGGFEHAAIVADLDENGTDELYVAADEQGELRRYVWVDGRARRETIHSRDVPRSMMTWNIMPVPVSVLEPSGQPSGEPTGGAGAGSSEKAPAGGGE